MSGSMDRFVWGMRILLGAELLAIFISMFWWIRKNSLVHNVVLRVQKNWFNQSGLIQKMDKMLLYSGLHHKWPLLTTEKWIFLQVFVMGGMTLSMVIWRLTIWKGMLILAGIFAVEYVLISKLMAGNYKRVDEDLLKFLDFLGNYSITSGEITSIFYQISRYLAEPLRGVLQECYYEAQTFGDTSAALISMSNKIQHPKFKEVIRNIEVTMRYSADFTILVNQSRRAVREHMKLRQERKALAREAGINMLILGGMTAVIFLAVEKLAGVSMEKVLFETWIGRGSLLGIGLIVFLFYLQVRKID